MLTTIFLALAGLIVLVLIIASFKSNDCHFERSITLSAPASAAFPYVSDLHKWQEMSPYVKLDPNAQYTFTTPASGVGAAMTWSGNGNVGAGKLTIMEIQSNELVRMRLEMGKPFKCDNVVRFTLKQSGPQTTVTWAMSGKSNFISKVMSIFMNMDKMVGRQFEEGLGNLKRLVESAGRK